MFERFTWELRATLLENHVAAPRARQATGLKTEDSSSNPHTPSAQRNGPTETRLE